MRACLDEVFCHLFDSLMTIDLFVLFSLLPPDFGNVDGVKFDRQVRKHRSLFEHPDVTTCTACHTWKPQQPETNGGSNMAFKCI